MNRSRVLAIVCSAILYCASPSPAADAPADPKPAVNTPPPIVRTERNVEGWRVRVDDRLLNGKHADLGVRALRLLGDKLYEIAQIMPSEQLEKLRAVVILLDYDHGKLTSMQYHPGAEWLRDHGYDPVMVKCVHLPSVRRFLDLNHQRTQPWCVMHELAHAFHDQVLSFDQAELRAVYEAAKQAGGYEKVLHIHGHQTRHYALTNHHEYFAELTEAYVGTNDFYPFVRGELKQHDPRAFELLEKIWGRLP